LLIPRLETFEKSWCCTGDMVKDLPRGGYSKRRREVIGHADCNLVDKSVSAGAIQESKGLEV